MIKHDMKHQKFTFIGSTHHGFFWYYYNCAWVFTKGLLGSKHESLNISPVKTNKPRNKHLALDLGYFMLVCMKK